MGNSIKITIGEEQMTIENIAVYSTGWTCLHCKCHNSENLHVYTYKFGDKVRCFRCKTEFFVGTMPIEKDPSVILEEKREKLEKDIRNLITEFDN